MLQDDLETVETLVYDVGIDITLEKLEEMGYSERLELLMSSVFFCEFDIVLLRKCP